MNTSLGLILYLISIAYNKYPNTSVTDVINSNAKLLNINKNIEEQSAFIVNNGSDILLKVPYFNQIDNLNPESKDFIGTTACGPTAITMLLNFYGTNTNIDSVINKLPNSVYVKGKMFYNLYEGGKPFGMKSVRIKNTYKDIYYTLKSGNPIILNVQNYDGITGHALVVIGIKNYKDENAEALIVHDPYAGPYREFAYITQNQLKQPEGYVNYIGGLEPFYFTKNENKISYNETIR